MSSSAPRGGSDFDLDRLVALCRPYHAQRMPPIGGAGWLVTPLGGGRFTFALIHAPNKWAIRS